MKLRDGIRVECDNCSTSANLRAGDRITLTTKAGLFETELTWKAGRPTGDVLNALVTRGWVVTSPRNEHGRYDRYEQADRLPNRVQSRSLFLVCRACAPTWVPPYSAAAAREIERMRLMTAPGGDEVSVLRDEIRRLTDRLEKASL